MLCLPRGRTRGTQAPWPGRMRSTPSELLARPPYRCAGVLACGAVACSHITACFGLFSIEVGATGLGPQFLTISLPHLRLSLPLLRPSPRSHHHTTTPYPTTPYPTVPLHIGRTAAQAAAAVRRTPKAPAGRHSRPCRNMNYVAQAIQLTDLLDPADLYTS